MLAKQCPSCQKYTPGEYSECLACGSSLRPTAAASTNALQRDSTPSKARELVCPKCQSPHLSGNKEGFGLGKAAVGGILLGGVGLLGGFFGAGKVRVTCLQCGYSWQAGKK